MGLKELQKQLFIEYTKNGYLKMWNDAKPEGIGDLAELGLIGTEISEAIEVIRSKIAKDPLELAMECADIIIRTMNFMSRKGIDVSDAIWKAHQKNLKRGHLHGKNI